MTKMHEAIIELIKINKETDFVDFKEFLEYDLSKFYVSIRLNFKR